MKAYYRTHAGLVRDQNEDTVLADEKEGLYILAEGRRITACLLWKP